MSRPYLHIGWQHNARPKEHGVQLCQGSEVAQLQRFAGPAVTAPAAHHQQLWRQALQFARIGEPCKARTPPPCDPSSTVYTAVFPLMTRAATAKMFTTCNTEVILKAEQPQHASSQPCGDRGVLKDHMPTTAGARPLLCLMLAVHACMLGRLLYLLLLSSVRSRLWQATTASLRSSVQESNCHHKTPPTWCDANFCQLI